MLENPVNSPLLAIRWSDTAQLQNSLAAGSDNVRDAENQQERLLYKDMVGQ
jgi:hypothetical protein